VTIRNRESALLIFLKGKFEKGSNDSGAIGHGTMIEN